ncbi:23S rRNA (pseudouridine(1915)-N(3))-methyltransferase RlmH [Campylobacter sp. JMF_02 ED1]|uniref:23S rRNA (pseudouridine(1915)-N(3))-methyltransferase RlmH n=1 Tax=Campylobacter sp. JMF_02 ED1 TaxID=2983826 RepID=UPI0022E9E1DA|nr:23S rRNA (pseudouridine(1915)-N(3))-methyltransferase RlmH [Campylobacter sp. JMF_02 ED1]MDA3051702.1 23S rRNA (pseudouridine(1915)-N(3))-methyltransferase RlmH [Campylobacter sp. JMF_02 ED1]
MQIIVNSIQKGTDEFASELNEYRKMSAKFASIKDEIFFNASIAKAQTIDRVSALRAYDEVYMPRLKGYNIALDERGEELDSMEFAKILDGKNLVSFFIGGAYGLSDDFKGKCDKIISLTKLTLAHKIAKLMLFEQIFRALCINANHPYHK